MSLQEALKLMRLELGITQADLAEKLNKAFITVNRWENGKGFPSRENAKKILGIAKDGNVSKDCYDYLNEMLMPDSKRSKSAAAYGFPDIDRDFLFQLADGSMNALYVIEAGTYNLLYANRKAESLAASYLHLTRKPNEKKCLTKRPDKRCFNYFGNRTSPCPFCPLSRFGSGEYTDTLITIPEAERTLLAHAKLTKMKGRSIYIIYLTDTTEENAERNALYELTNDIPEGVGIYHVYYDDRISLAFMNGALYRMIGAERKEALLKTGESDLSLIHPGDIAPLWTEIRASIADKRNINILLRMRIKNGKYHCVRLFARLIKKDTEKFTFYCVFRDITQ